MLRVLEQGEHLGIYHIGTDVEMTIADLAQEVARCFGREIRVVPGELRPGARRGDAQTSLGFAGWDTSLAFLLGRAWPQR